MSNELRALFNVLVIEDKSAGKNNSGIMLHRCHAKPPNTGRVFSIGDAVKKEHPNSNSEAVYFRPFNGRQIVWQGTTPLLGRQEALAFYSSA
jgi:co-chaperonin GroES (HSP10)